VGPRDRPHLTPQSHFGGSVTRTTVKELPWLLFVWLIGLFTLGWQVAFINAAVLLIFILGFRVWARRRYGVDSERPAPGAAEPE
jgi:hypothetical protein